MRTLRTSHLLAVCMALAAMSGSAAAQNPLGMAGIVKNADGTYTRMVGDAPAFTWLKITPGKDF